MSQLLDTIETVYPSSAAISRALLPASAANGKTNPEGMSEPARIAQSIAYMKAHVTDRLHITDLAASVNVSPSHYFALFKRHTGSSPINFLIHLRMQHACRLLETTALSVKEIAAVLGYEDAFYFSRQFKAVIGIAPTGYRMVRTSMKDELKPRRP